MHRGWHFRTRLPSHLNLIIVGGQLPTIQGGSGFSVVEVALYFIVAFHLTLLRECHDINSTVTLCLTLCCALAKSLKF